MIDKLPLQFSLDSLPLACMFLSDNYKINYMNPAMITLLNSAETWDYSGKSFLDYISTENHQAFFDFIQSLNQLSGQPNWQTLKIVCEDNTEKQLLVNGHWISNYEHFVSKYFLAGLPVDDKDDKYRSGSDFASSYSSNLYDSHYESVFNNAPIGIALLNEAGIIKETNDAFLNHIGANKSTILNQHYCTVMTNPIKAKVIALTKLLYKSKHHYIKDVVVQKKAGERHKILEISISEFFDQNETSRNLLLFTEDITHQQDTHAALLQSEKLALTGRLAASLAHEINNPLQTSLGCLGLVEEMLNEDDDRDLAVYIKMAIEELQRGARIVKKLRDLNRTTDLTERTQVELCKIIEDVLLLTKNQLYDKNIVPVFPYQGPPVIVLASKDQIQQVILNLVMNAIDALPDGGNIYFDIIQTNDPHGVTVKIRDTGMGIKPELKKSLFEPFFTTKEEGLGLGLYICRQIIDDHAGSLNFDTELGQGTEFTIWLPGIDT